MRKSITLTIVFMFLATIGMMAQNVITGVVVDDASGESLPGASVVVKGTTQGTITGVDGSFKLTVESTNLTITVSYVGYLAKDIAINGQTDLGKIKLKSDAVGLEEVNVIASVAVDRKTPVAVSKVDPVVIEEKLGTMEFPQILKSTPSVYATRQGGGYGDSRINLRGFDSRNIAVMINGVPVNDMENGWVYWSNWAGLADVTRSMQVQRGLGASRVALPSVGGTINVLTKTTDMKKGGSVYTSIGNDAYNKTALTLSTGKMENGLAVTGSFSHTKGDGYVNGTQFEAWSYFFNASKRLNTKHMLSFTIFGAPQWHGQRSSALKLADYYNSPEGIKYNADWGYKDGQVYYLRKNFYHKPQAILNHYWNLTDNTTLSTAYYASWGTGGGTGPYGNYSKFDYRREGQIDFDRIVDENIARGALGSDAIMRASRNDHRWYGVLSNLRHEMDNLTVSTGLDVRYYKGEHFREVTDLLGGQYYVDNGDKNEPNKIVKEGDKIAYHNDGLVFWTGTYGQVEYNVNKLSTFVAGTFSEVFYKRVDYFNYAPDENSTAWVPFIAYSGKGGANYNLTDNHNIFFNAGYIARQPDFRSVFLNYKNDVNPNAKDEKILSFELGYGLRTGALKMNVNLFNTEWKDKTFIKSFRQPDGSYYTANIEGVNALHRGVEMDFRYQPVKSFYMTGMVSVGDYRWKNNLENIILTDENQNEVGTVNLYIKDVPVGDAAQTTAAVGLNYYILKDLKIGADWNYFDRYYAKFDPTQGGYDQPADDGSNIEPWKVPSYNLLDLNLKYKFKMGGFNTTLTAKINNLFDTEYVSDAIDGSSHNWDTATGYMGFGRTWSVALKVKF